MFILASVFFYTAKFFTRYDLLRTLGKRGLNRNIMQKYQIHNVAKIILLFICLPCLCHARGGPENPSLDKLGQAISKLVIQHYPKATSHVFEQSIGFECSTRVYVTPMISKVQPPPTETVRGPMEDGVWCDIWYRKGDLGMEPAYARGEGVTSRAFFKEHMYYPNDPQKKCHLMVTLRLPLETTSEQKQFVEELRGLLKQFGTYLP